jgi:CMP-N-acetylneuraminic acid synthetase
LKLNIGSLINFEIIAEDDSVSIEKIQLISNGGKIVKEIQCNNKNDVIWKPFIIASNIESWYVVKVIHSNGKWGISSPIFIKTNE